MMRQYHLKRGYLGTQKETSPYACNYLYLCRYCGEIFGRAILVDCIHEPRFQALHGVCSKHKFDAGNKYEVPGAIPYFNLTLEYPTEVLAYQLSLEMIYTEFLWQIQSNLYRPSSYQGSTP